MNEDCTRIRRSSRRAPRALAVLVLACSSAESDSQKDSAPDSPGTPSPESVEFRRVEPAALRAAVSASGSIEARRISELGSEVSGRIAEVAVDVGDWVQAGALLFRIDPVPYQTALAEARAELALAQAEAENAAREEERASALVSQHIASQQSFEALHTRAEMARARVEQMRARVARAERDLAHTRVTAPYAGSVVERHAHEGALAGGEPVIVLQESAALEAVLNVPEASLVPVRIGDPVRLYAEGRPEPLELAVTRVSDRVQPDTRTYEVRAELPEPVLKAGSYVHAEVLPARAQPLPVVPGAAIRSIDGRTYVFRLLEGARVERVHVRLGISEGERIEVLAGLALGDHVAVGEVVQRLADGASVEPSSLAATAGAGKAGEGP